MRNVIALLLIFVLVMSAGCQIAKKTTEKSSTDESGDVAEIEKEIEEINSLEKDIDLSDLDELDEDLALI